MKLSPTPTENANSTVDRPLSQQEFQKRLLDLGGEHMNFPKYWAIDSFLQVNGLYERLTIRRFKQLSKLCAKAYKAAYNKPPKRVPHPSYINGQDVYPYQLIYEVYKQWIIRNNAANG